MAPNDPKSQPTETPWIDESSQVRLERTFALTIAYDGSLYAGWQIQPNGLAIQQVLADAIKQVVHHSCIVNGSGRTDAGVHAIGQVASLRSPNWKLPASRLIQAINRHLPRDICVVDCKNAVPGFDPIRHATAKRYRYTLRSSRIPDPLQYPFHWWIPKDLDLGEMQVAAKRLLGTHDFKAFESLGSPRKSSVRTIYAIDVYQRPSPIGLQNTGVEICIEIEADGFLYNMVRNIAGALVEIGKARFSPLWIESILKSAERSSFSQTAPARGLCLLHVKYPANLFLPDDDQSQTLPSNDS
ncbi:MAG: tRNA pseudouridine synthase [Planctomycetota bacterium]|jgi:tRNA pseudouridine38-40 synthase